MLIPPFPAVVQCRRPELSRDDRFLVMKGSFWNTPNAGLQYVADSTGKGRHVTWLLPCGSARVRGFVTTSEELTYQLSTGRQM